MALIPPFALDSVVAIGFGPSREAVSYGATGFLLGIEHSAVSSDEVIYGVFLVTNRHVFEGSSKAFLRFNPIASEPAAVFDLNLLDKNNAPMWHAHPDPGVDVAVTSLNLRLLDERSIQYSFFIEKDHALTTKQAEDAGIAEGDGVFALGFPMGNVGKERNYVVVRQGAIARIRDLFAGAVNEFLIDAVVFPGNSGGPVLSRPEITSISGTQSVSGSWLLGMVSAYLPYQDIAYSKQTQRPRIIFEENSGLASVVPIQFVLDVAREVMKKLPPPPSDLVTREHHPRSPLSSRDHR